jgi:hypothetical protein
VWQGAEKKRTRLELEEIADPHFQLDARFEIVITCRRMYDVENMAGDKANPISMLGYRCPRSVLSINIIS